MVWNTFQYRDFIGVYINSTFFHHNSIKIRKRKLSIQIELNIAAGSCLINMVLLVQTTTTTSLSWQCQHRKMHMVRNLTVAVVHFFDIFSHLVRVNINTRHKKKQQVERQFKGNRKRMVNYLRNRSLLWSHESLTIFHLQFLCCFDRSANRMYFLKFGKWFSCTFFLSHSLVKMFQNCLDQ